MNVFDINRPIQLAMGCLTVNRNVLDILDDNLIARNFVKTVYNDSCVHVVHGSLKEETLKSLCLFSRLYSQVFFLGCCINHLPDVMYILEYFLSGLILME